MSQIGDTYKLHPQNKMLSWLDDNETKYKWNGELINLSDMAPSDYATTIFHIVGLVSGVSESALTVNPITVEVTGGETNYNIKATATYALKSDLVLNVKVGSSNMLIPMSLGTSTVIKETTVPTTSPIPAITSAAVTPSSDASYAYGAVIKGSGADSFLSYHGTALQEGINDITVQDILGLPTNVINAEGSVLDFVIPHRTILNPTPEELKQFTYCLVFALPKSIRDGNKYKIVDATFGQSSDFQKLKDITLNGTEYTILCNYSESTEFIGRYNEDITYKFKASYINE